MGYGIVSKIGVDKNHLTNTAYEGEFVITADTILPNNKAAVDAYKKSHKESWGEIFVSDSDGEEITDDNSL